jgi:deoxyribodipyrimidine photolyase-related protein
LCMGTLKAEKARNLVIVLGDQLNPDSAAFDGFDRDRDAVWMAEVSQEAAYVWSHKLRIAYFFSAMRHFRDLLRQRDFRVIYHSLTGNPSEDQGQTLADVLQKSVRTLEPDKLIVVLPGDYRALSDLKRLSKGLNIELEIRRDRHFYLDVDEFVTYAHEKKKIVLETFYRHMRKEHHILLDISGKPLGGSWNFDRENRKTFGKTGPEHVPEPAFFPPDETTREVIDMVRLRFNHHPGRLDDFTAPVCREDALKALDDFSAHRLPLFGTFEDAMWTNHPFLYHSRLSAPLNLKLISPGECVASAVNAFEAGYTPISSVEGFIRQIIGWREFIRGIYWLHMPDYGEKNHLEHMLDVPSFFWDGDTTMECIRQTMRSILTHAYTHHIQRLMIMGLYALLQGVNPKKFHEWHMAMYIDAVDWVSLPNTIGMSQYADGGIVGTKPYCASGNYINKMSNYCAHCVYDYHTSSGTNACPFTTLYWNFLDRHYDKLKANMRLAFQLQALMKKRLDKEEMNRIRLQAQKLKQR